MKSSEFNGKKVIDKDGFEVGKVSDLDLNMENWHVDGVYISSGILGSDFRVSIEEIATVGDFVILNIEKKKE